MNETNLAEVYADEERSDVREGIWTPLNLQDLDWCLRRIAELEAEIAENNAVAAARIAEVKARTEKLNATAQRGVEFFENCARTFAEQNRELLLKGGKKKSRALPSGTVGWRKSGGRARKADEAALLEWARQQPVEKGFVRIAEEPAWDVIKTHVELTGEDVPGVEFEPEGEELQIKPSKAGTDNGNH